MKRTPCETCIAVVELTNGRKARCRWCDRGCPPYDPDARDRSRAAKRQLELGLGLPLPERGTMPAEKDTPR